MIRLNQTQPETTRIDLGHGVALICKPCTSAIYRAATAWTTAEIFELRKAAAEKQAGASLEEGEALPPLSGEQAEIEGLSTDLLIRGLARYGVIDWEGVGDAKGEPLEVTREAVDTLFQQFWGFGDTFLAAYLAPMQEVEAEKNASAPAANGATAAGETTAGTAETSENPAPKGSPEQTESAVH